MYSTLLHVAGVCLIVTAPFSTYESRTYNIHVHEKNQVDSSKRRKVQTLDSCFGLLVLIVCTVYTVHNYTCILVCTVIDGCTCTVLVVSV